MSNFTVPESMRLTKAEQQKLHSACIRINKQLMAMDKMPIRESELAHMLIEKGLDALTVTKSGSIEIDR